MGLLQLNDPQRQAVAAPGNVVVTAGAGSGKTRTLVARYLHHLEEGVPLREIVAITFTEKAAREMRNRIRRTIAGLLPTSPVWRAALPDLDAARIGTIHSLCAHILRAHPVEAARDGVNPGFGVLEEGRAALLRARAVEDALAWAAEEDAASRLFRPLGEFGLRTAVSLLLGRRLDAAPAFGRLSDDPLQDWTGALLDWLGGHLDGAEWRAALDDLAALRAADPTDKMELARQAALAHAEAADEARRRGEVGAALAELVALRSSATLNGRKANWPGDTLAAAKAAMRALRDYFDARLAPLVNPKKPAAWALDEEAAGLIWPLHAVYRRALALYERVKRAENLLDFDDLEAGALALLREPSVRADWQARVRAVLVDEFQDTNERQREIVYALSGFSKPQTSNSNSQTGALFIVGDSKQSIYMFRGADVTVFRRVQEDVARAGGQVIPLDLTFRAHRALVEESNRLLAPALDEIAQPGRPYAVPFAPLRAHRQEARPGERGPFVEFLLGLGQNAAAGRQAAADGLAARLLELHAQGTLAWEDAALLFRASTAFPVYEDALERAGIPFVTVAGRGFYDRPEVRTLLNGLVALADPTDDLALAGLLRSPLVGLSDAALYLLRYPPLDVVERDEHAPCQVWAMLHHAALPEILPPAELATALWGRDLVEELHALSGRAPVAALLKRLLDRTNYRAALQAAEGGGRARRNVDKLLADAHTSGLVSVREFVEYVRALRDVGARESEAPTEAGSAVQLMTVHKSKGLEFPVVVIADAGHAGRSGSAPILLDGLLGVTVNLVDEEGRRPAAYLLAALHNRERDEAENRRLLYVAATRARERLLVSGHAKILKGGGLGLAGWLKLLGGAAGLDGVTVAGMPVEAQMLPLSENVGCVLYPGVGDKEAGGQRDKGTGGQGYGGSIELVAPLPESGREQEGKRSSKRREAGRVVGRLVHAALRQWRFPDRPGLADFLRPFALQAGLTGPDEIERVIAIARRLLARFQTHPLYAKLDRVERHHELPYTLEVNGVPRSGVVDLLARLDEGWTVVEFKTDQLEAGADLGAYIKEAEYDEQVRRYAAALERLMGARPRALLVFLNVGGAVEVVRLDSSGGM